LQFTKQAVIETYTLFLNNFKTAKEAIKTTCQAKPAFARFLEVNNKTTLVMVTCSDLFGPYKYSALHKIFL
jgi:hypothetical protein